MKILVTGASGFLGRSLCRRLTSEGHDVTGITRGDADLRVFGSLESCTRDKYDTIYHLAAWTQAGDFCLFHPGEQWIINQTINTHVLGWWQSYHPQAKMVTIGTSCSYDPNLPLVEGNYLIGVPIKSLYTYAMTKRILQVGLQALADQYKLNWLTVVPSTLYGPDYHLDGRQMHFIFDLIRKILRGKLFGEPVVLWGDGLQKRELIHVDDFGRILTVLVDQQADKIVNVGAGEEHTIRHFANIICEIAEYNSGDIQYDTGRYTGAKSKCLDTSLLESLVGDIELIPLETGIRRVIDWFLLERATLLPHTASIV